MGSERLTQIAADAVGAAQRRLPPELRALARGVAVHYEEKPGADVIAEGRLVVFREVPDVFEVEQNLRRSGMIGAEFGSVSGSAE